MTHARVDHAARPCVWIVGLAALLAGASVVPANVTPPTMLLIHVQPWDPNYCDLPGVNDCEDLVQTTSQAGELLFVVYLVCAYNMPGRLVSADFTLQWSWAWWLYDLANCTGAEFSYDYDYENRITLHFHWPEHAYVESFMPLCTFVMGVGAHDCMEVLDDATIGWANQYRGMWYEPPLPGRAEAAVECEYTCLLDCDQWNCMPQLTPEELHFELYKGEVGLGLLQSVVTGCAAWPCQFDATEPWVRLEAKPTSGTTHDIYVTVDTADLAVGEHEARVRATYDTRDCSRIFLTVREGNPQTIPDDGAAGPDASKRTTWGGVKELYRGRPTR